jgi:serine/threonine protein kinase
MLLGSGTFGHVYRIHGDQKKVLKKGKEVQHQYQVLKTIHHPNIVQVYEFTLKPDSMVMQGLFVENNWLELDKFIEKEYNVDVAVRWIPQLVDAVEFLHSRGIAHCDIKPQNVFIKTVMRAPNNNVGIKLIDFGLACREPVCPIRGGTRLYLSPQILDAALEKNTTRTMDEFRADDLWALGITLFQVVHGGKNPVDFYRVNCTYRGLLNFYSQVSPLGRHLIPTVNYFGDVVDPLEKFTRKPKRKDLKTFLGVERTDFLGRIEDPEVKQRVDYRKYLRFNPPSRNIPMTKKQQQQQQNIQKIEDFAAAVKSLYTILRQKRQSAYKEKVKQDQLAVIRGAWRKPTPTWQVFVTEAETNAGVETQLEFFTQLTKNDARWNAFWKKMIEVTRADRKGTTTKAWRKLTGGSQHRPQDFRIPTLLQEKQQLDAMRKS